MTDRQRIEVTGRLFDLRRVVSGPARRQLRRLYEALVTDAALSGSVESVELLDFEQFPERFDGGIAEGE